HRFRMGRTPETGLTPAEWREFPRYALARILMHAVKTKPARFWQETDKTGNKPSENPPETRRLCFYGMHEYARKCIARKFTPFSRGKSCFRRSSHPKTVNGDAIYCVAVKRCRRSRKTGFQHVQESGSSTAGNHVMASRRTTHHTIHRRFDS
ncbi:hypothetical protein C0Q74_28050, partial [Klebsiella pneumoniae]|nr:hypothetical protein [Klebsiella pneumoniae]